jgi:hypothetical protein
LDVNSYHDGDNLSNFKATYSFPCAINEIDGSNLLVTFDDVSFSKYNRETQKLTDLCQFRELIDDSENFMSTVVLKMVRFKKSETCQAKMRIVSR